MEEILTKCEDTLNSFRKKKKVVNVVSADHPKAIGRHATVDNAIDVGHVYLDKRLSTSVSAVTKGIMKEHLLLLATIMICVGMLVGFNQAGIKALSKALNFQALFSEATFFYAAELQRKLRMSINQTKEPRDMNGQSYQPSHMNFAPALQHQVQPSISPNDRSASIEQPHYAYNNSSAEQTTDPSNQPLDFGRRYGHDHDPYGQSTYGHESKGSTRGLSTFIAKPSISA
uniref:Nuclear RNA polymerase D1B n=1 Tax=Tanacetum cinerariifolium TaxID=118510 RepID=A0A699ITN5_TANCI|nr:nuclear RNA polymerase D1B [Tanacetum cinerariifolium]